MDVVVEIISCVLLLLGSFFALVGGIGLVRLPEFYSRTHAAGVTDTMGAGCVLLGLAFQAGLSLVTVKLLMILLILLITSPTSAHALAQAAWTHGLKPLLGDEETKPSRS